MRWLLGIGACKIPILPDAGRGSIGYDGMPRPGEARIFRCHRAVELGPGEAWLGKRSSVTTRETRDRASDTQASPLLLILLPGVDYRYAGGGEVADVPVDEGQGVNGGGRGDEGVVEGRGMRGTEIGGLLGNRAVDGEDAEPVRLRDQAGIPLGKNLTKSSLKNPSRCPGW